jgi:hypothetical protein
MVLFVKMGLDFAGAEVGTWAALVLAGEPAAELAPAALVTVTEAAGAADEGVARAGAVETGFVTVQGQLVIVRVVA